MVGDFAVLYFVKDVELPGVSLAMIGNAIAGRKLLCDLWCKEPSPYFHFVVDGKSYYSCAEREVRLKKSLYNVAYKSCLVEFVENLWQSQPSKAV